MTDSYTSLTENLRKHIGRRVRLLRTNDPYTKLTAGSEGVLSSVDDAGTVFVKWDDGSTLGLIMEAGDRFRFVD